MSCEAGYACDGPTVEKQCEAFVDEVAKLVEPKHFASVCVMAADGRMGFGPYPQDWGDAETGKG